MTSRTVERIRRDGRTGERRVKEMREARREGRTKGGYTRRIRTISYNHPCLLSFFIGHTSSPYLPPPPAPSNPGSRYSSGPHAFLYLTIVGQRSTSRAGNGLLTNPCDAFCTRGTMDVLLTLKDTAGTSPLTRPRSNMRYART